MSPKISLSGIAFVLIALPAAAQQTGVLTGKVTAKNGAPMAGVQVEAVSSVMPQARKVITGANGQYHMPFLPPGPYVLTFAGKDLMTAKRATDVALQQTSTVNVSMAEQQVAGAEVAVVATTAMVDTSSTAVKSTLHSDTFQALPIGQDYRDLVKLVPGVMYTQDKVRGPSAGGSGQDNIAQIDGVNVNMPMFGVMAAQPSSHDIDQVTIIKGGADATGFNRSAGFTINSISKTGTNTFTGELQYQVLPDSMVAKRLGGTAQTYEQGKTFSTLNVGGPILKDKLFFFLSVYRPTTTQKNGENLYGALPDYSDTRKEYFGKLTYAPMSNLLIHASYRNSDEDERNSGFGSTGATTTGVGNKGKYSIGIVEASWNVTPSSYINFRGSSYINKMSTTPDYLSPVRAALDGSVLLDVNRLNTQGGFAVPTPMSGTSAAATAYNALIAPMVTKYGYLDPATGLATGGGQVGGTSRTTILNFYRRDYQLSYDAVWGNSVTHTFHAGAQWSKDMQDMYYAANGWGLISVIKPSSSASAPYLPTSPSGVPFVFRSTFYQQGLGTVPIIHSESETLNYEVNDKIKWQNFTFNVGFLLSNDKLYGQGLREDSSMLSGYSLAVGHKYLMKEVKLSDTFQPRLGLTWNYAKEDTVYASYGRFIPAASSLPRAASWDRSLGSSTYVYFDGAGKLVDKGGSPASSGKLFQPGIKPRHTDEILIGTTKDLGDGWNGRLFSRYRKSVNFWEDTPNGARIMYDTPAGVPKDFYIPNLSAMLNQMYGVTSKTNYSPYVIAQLDGAFTKYYEVGTELEWRRDKLYLNLSYTWSHYYGNFDQDNSESAGANDNVIANNVYLGSSQIADGAGRQLWNNKYGNLAGDRRHKLKLFGSYDLPWEGRIGAYFIYQSGQPWQYNNYQIYTKDFNAEARYPGADGTSDQEDYNAYGESAGSRVTAPHYQLDLTYTQTFWKTRQYRLEGQFDIFNVFNRQTGYNIRANMNDYSASILGTPGSYMAPRRAQLGIRFLF